MELVLRNNTNEKNEPKQAPYQLCIDHQEGSIGFVVLGGDNLQIDFLTNLEGWKQMKTFIDDSIYEYEHNKKD